jgi:hypothetical protein
MKTKEKEKQIPALFLFFFVEEAKFTAAEKQTKVKKVINRFSS